MVLAGDFNCSDQDAGAELLVPARFLDVWPSLHADHPGITFDPDVNPLAALNSLSGQRQRLDRILLHTKPCFNHTMLRASAVTLVGTSGFCLPPEIKRPGATDSLGFLSDHFGLFCNFNWEVVASSLDHAATNAAFYQAAVDLVDGSTAWQQCLDEQSAHCALAVTSSVVVSSLNQMLQSHRRFESKLGNIRRRAALLRLEQALNQVWLRDREENLQRALVQGGSEVT